MEEDIIEDEGKKMLSLFKIAVINFGFNLRNTYDNWFS